MNKDEIVVALMEVREGIGMYIPEANDRNKTKEEKAEILTKHNQALKDLITEVVRAIVGQEGSDDLSIK